MKQFFQILWSCDDGSFHDSLEEPAKAVEFDAERDFTIFGSCNGLLCLFDMNHGCVLSCITKIAICLYMSQSTSFAKCPAYHGGQGKLRPLLRKTVTIMAKSYHVHNISLTGRSRETNIVNSVIINLL